MPRFCDRPSRLCAPIHAVLLVCLAIPGPASAATTTIVSSPSWTVTLANGTVLNAQNVCLNATAPLNCPTGATLYGYAFAGWTADLSSIRGATWIWAPNVTGTTANAANAEFDFWWSFYLCDTPTSGSISLAADNSAEVFINGVSVLKSTSHSTLSTLTLDASILSNIAHGPFANTIRIHVKNDANPADCASGLYSCNPAGVVFGASIADAVDPYPSCTGVDGKMYKAGSIEELTCQPPQVGSPSQVCACVSNPVTHSVSGQWFPLAGKCELPPTCTGIDGRTAFKVGETESSMCPAGQMASPASHTCQSNGQWNVSLGSCVTPVTCTGIDGRTVFKVGQTESSTCPDGRIASAPTSHTCQSTGRWDVPLGSCVLPRVDVDQICGNSAKGYTATCPTGIDCAARRTWSQQGINQAWQVSTATSDWYCGDWNYALGRSCTFPQQCASGNCDIGWNTSNTRVCVARVGAGNINDWCSNNNQCASGRCGGLNQDIFGAWHAGRCSTGPSGLGEFCSVNTDCASTYCDRGDGTSKTSKCMPRAGAGTTNNWCSNNNQCSSGVCVGLQPGPNGTWQPGHCR